MTRGRKIVSGIGLILILFGLVLQFRPDLADNLLAPLRQPGAGPILLGVALVLASLFEGRYRSARQIGDGDRPGWERTGETFRDEETGRWIQVWYHPQSGERRYLPTERAG